MRKQRAVERDINPDPVYNDKMVAKFINLLMIDGKKSKAEDVFYNALKKFADQVRDDALRLFHGVLDAVKPKLEVRSRRVGGATYQVPVMVRKKRAYFKAIRWLIDAARSRSGNSMIENLSAEFLDAHNNKGTAIKKREECEKMAESNKAYAHYSWGASEKGNKDE